MRSPSRLDYLDRDDTLIVLRGAEIFLMIDADGHVTGFNGHVDLGTGIRTALGQIVAEELDVPLDRVTMILGDSEAAPDQGPTIASETIQVTAMPLRLAAAQARHFLIGLAADLLGLPADDLRIEDGIILADAAQNARIELGALLKGRRDRLVLSDSVALKPVSAYRVVGQAVARVDIPAKATGQFTYVQDVRVPGMLHGHVVRPPYAGLDSGDFVGTSLISVDSASIVGMPGVIATVVVGDFVGIAAERPEQAAVAASRLRILWKPCPALPDLGDLKQALIAQPSQKRVLLDQGDVDQAIASADKRLQRTYVWPYQMHGSIGPSCAVADYRKDGLTIWSGTQNPLPLRADLSLLLGMPETSIEIVRLEAAGCYGRNCADDVAADAALLSRAVGRPVRVQLTREQEHLWEPKGAAQLISVDGGLTATGEVAAYDFQTRYPSNAAPTLALLLTGIIPPVPAVLQMGDRTAIPPYRFGAMRVVVHDMAPIVRASWLRGVSALPNSFAHDSYIDELATEAGVDPVQFRLRYLDDERGSALLKSVADRAEWEERTGPRRTPVRDGVQRGQGVAYARYVHGKFPGTAAAWSAWVAEVEVDTESGDVAVTKVTVGQDTGLVINPAGVQHQIHGNVIQSVSRTLKEMVSFDRQAVTSREWGTYPILTFPEVPVIQVVMLPRPDDPPLGAGESASVPSAAAIANAIFDATGVRLREPPFTPDRVRAALRAAEAAKPPPPPAKLGLWRRLGWFSGGVIGLGLALLPWRSAIAPITPPDPQLYSAETIERGRQLAGLGACAVCHTEQGGIENAGGRKLETPFGIVIATNITPDPETGIGRWSYPAFERAMREGIHRDGRHLYPAFPYTAFARTSEADLQALYAYLMAQTPVRAAVPATRLSFPFNLRPLMAVWNALFLPRGTIETDPTQSAQWNRGAYLVEGLGHCSACHSPRNALGAEKGGAQHFAGGWADGWEAPPLTALSHAPVPWSEDEFYTYLRTGVARFHGAAAGPMVPVVAGLSGLPDRDIRAMARYLASFGVPDAATSLAQKAAAIEARIETRPPPGTDAGARIFEGACASCHEPGSGSLTEIRPSLALNSTLSSKSPDNALHAILDGVTIPGLGTDGAMPGFRDSLDNRQLANLLHYLRARFAPDKPAWRDVAATAGRIRDNRE
jgi:nicotinate dehydrogenase subunit B